MVAQKRSREAKPSTDAPVHEGDATVAAAALVNYLKKQDESKAATSLLPEASKVFVSIQFLQSLPRRVSKIKCGVVLPHPIYTREDQEVCLITTGPQRKWKDKLQGQEGLENIKKIIDMNKLRKKYKAFESKRQLATGFNCFIADTAVAPFLPQILGKTFFQRNKEPLTINMTRAPRSIIRALHSTHYSIQDNANLSVLLGSTEFSAEELAANYRAVVDDIVSRWCPNGWKDVQSVSLKGVDTPALPVYAHNYVESSTAPPTQNVFPKRVVLELPELVEEPKAKRVKKDDKAEAASAEDEDEESEEGGLSDLSEISGIESGDEESEDEE